ncbi:hypothetical protein DSCA_52230 [Desulfosarcina alkanivorans]|uniref:Uncharacterized protein n=1 Tax=Desulfosarcina alkanivorans TaxID=571177 RepID=A0A5K7YT75_9BACT|nr:hypothetical protein DSCA_52230 [Desulfosarcina alkanivorans]
MNGEKKKHAGKKIALIHGYSPIQYMRRTTCVSGQMGLAVSLMGGDAWNFFRVSHL